MDLSNFIFNPGCNLPLAFKLSMKSFSRCVPIIQTSCLLSIQGKAKAEPIAPAPIITIFDILAYSLKKIFLNKIRIDINSILPIIINIIKNNFVLLKRLVKLILLTPYKDELVVLVNVSMDNLKEFSKFMSSRTSMLESMKILIKKDIKTKNDRFII